MHVVKSNTEATFETDPLGYVLVSSVVHLEPVRKLCEPKFIRENGTPDVVTRLGNEDVHDPTDKSPLETRLSPISIYPYTGGDEVLKGYKTRDDRFKRCVVKEKNGSKNLKES